MSKKYYEFKELSVKAQAFAQGCAKHYLEQSGLDNSEDAVNHTVNNALYTADGYYICMKNGMIISA